MLVLFHHQHAKHLIIDDVATYIGSQNLDDEEQTKKMMDQYWNPMWKSSFTGEDCDVDSVMDGLKINRDSDPAATYTEDDVAAANAMMAQGGTDAKRFYEGDEATITTETDMCA